MNPVLQKLSAHACIAIIFMINVLCLCALAPAATHAQSSCCAARTTHHSVPQDSKCPHCNGSLVVASTDAPTAPVMVSAVFDAPVFPLFSSIPIPQTLSVHPLSEHSAPPPLPTLLRLHCALTI